MKPVGQVQVKLPSPLTHVAPVTQSESFSLHSLTSVEYNQVIACRHIIIRLIAMHPWVNGMRVGIFHAPCYSVNVHHTI